MKKNFICLINIIFLLLLEITIVFSQSGNSTKLNANLPQNDEYIDVHVNKNIFVSGERLFYAVYLGSKQNKPIIETSMIVYFEIADLRANILHSWRTELLPKGAAGSIQLPDTISGGVCFLRAFTNSQRNFHLAYAEIPIIIAPKNEKTFTDLMVSSKEIASPPKVIPLVYRKLTGGFQISLTASDKLSPPLSIELRKRAKRVYYGILNDSNAYTLPVPSDVMGKKKTGVYLYSNSAQLLYSGTYSPELNSDNIYVVLDRNEYFPNELIELQIFNPNQKIADSCRLSVSVVKRNALESLPEAESKKMICPYPISVADASNGNKLILPDNHNHVDENPILIQNNSKPLAMKENNAFTLAGRLTESASGKAVSNVIVSASVSGNAVVFAYGTTNTEGFFQISLDSLFDNKLVYLQALNTSNYSTDFNWEIDNKNLEIQVDTNIERRRLSETQLIELAHMKYAESVERNYNMKNGITISEEEPVAITSFYGKPERIIYPAEFEQTSCFSEIATNLLPDIKLNKTIDSDTMNTLPKQSVLLFLNGILIENTEFISNIQSINIERIEVNSHEYRLGDLTFSGVISIFTRDKNIETLALNNNYICFRNKVEGTAACNTHKSLELSIPNIRTDVYWNPDAGFKGSERKYIQFSAPARRGNYRIEIKGMSSSGKPLYYLTSFIVR